MRYNFLHRLLGLCNNYAYVIMLSAAEALIKKSENQPTHDKDAVCNPLSTATILLADIIPSLITKLVSPFINISTRVRVSIAIILTVLSFLLTSFSNGHGMTFTGVICASISSGLGEVTFLAYAASFETGVVSFWSSGTGMAGLAGAGLYTLITSLVSVEACLLIMLIVPLIEASTFCFIISKPAVNSSRQSLLGASRGESVDQLTGESDASQVTLTLRQKVSFARPLVLRYMLPLGLVYFFEYFINQGLSELIYFTDSSIPRERQYPWYQTMYQLGVFISRSSVLIYRIDKLWLLPILQGINVLLLMLHILFPYFPSIAFVMALIAYEGLLGGASYVNTFYKIRLDSDESSRSFNMSFTALADSIGILLAALLAIPAHNILCTYMENRIR